MERVDVNSLMYLIRIDVFSVEVDCWLQRKSGIAVEFLAGSLCGCGSVRGELAFLGVPIRGAVGGWRFRREAHVLQR